MELILNELSLDGQFQNYREFADYVRMVLAPVLDIIIEKRIPLLKKTDIYSYMVTAEDKLQDFLIRSNEPEMTLLKRYIVELGYCPPYWDSDIKTDLGFTYEYPTIAKAPNCFTEAIERQCMIISFPHPQYAAAYIICRKNEEKIEITNITEARQLLRTYLAEDLSEIRYILEKYPFNRNVRLFEAGGKCYAAEALLENDLALSDYMNIIDTIPLLIADLDNGRKSVRWDKFNAEGFLEFRMNVNADRIFRLFFVQQNGLQFMNGFIKKTQKTPQSEIDKALRIKHLIENE